jgi:L-ribulose-5-phosphate 3-epimerase
MASSRRTFLKSLAALPVVGTVSRDSSRTDESVTAGAEQQARAAAPQKAVLISMLPETLSYADRFALAKDVGFAGVEMQTISDEREAEEIRRASEQTGLRVHSVMNAAHWEFPLSSADEGVVAKSVDGMATSIRNAALWGADVVLLVPAVVNAETSYRDAWTRSQRVIRDRILPLAETRKVIVGVEEVWNKFLLSPLEFAHYVDEFKSPWLRAYFDVGNIVFYGFPQDWIRTLGSRIVRIHLKDFKLDRRAGQFAWTNLGEGDVDWPAVRAALTDIGFDRWMTTEIRGGDRAYLADVTARVDRFLEAGRPMTR